MMIGRLTNRVVEFTAECPNCGVECLWKDIRTGATVVTISTCGCTY